jgi:hypothetical protein
MFGFATIGPYGFGVGVGVGVGLVDMRAYIMNALIN